MTFRTAVGLLVSTAVLLGCSGSQPEQTEDICGIFEEKSRWYREARRASQRWGVPIPVMMAFTNQESSFHSDARPPRQKLLWVIPWTRPTSAYGYAQATDEAWLDYERATGDNGDRDDFDDAMDFIGWYNSVSARRFGIQKDDAYRLYLAYHEGHGGYSRSSWERKPELKKIAKRVSDRARTYQSQLSRCEHKFRKRRFLPF